MKRNVVFTLAFFLLVAGWSQAQSVRLGGQITDKTGEPLANCTVMLLDADSSFIAGVISDAGGIYRLKIPAEGTYRVEISMLGYEKQLFTVEAGKNDRQLPKTVLQESAVALSAVTVTAYKQAVSFAPGKTTIDLAAALLASEGDAFEALKNMPGVHVSESGAVSLNGQPGAQVLVDGKPTYLTGENLVNLLRSMPASSVGKIELITHPSARYDAAGNSGAINLQTVRPTHAGLDVSVHSRYTQSRFAGGDGGFNLGYRNRKVNVLADYSFYGRKEYNDLHVKRTGLDRPDSAPSLEQAMWQDTYRTWDVRSHYGRIGIDYTCSEKMAWGVYASGTLADQSIDGRMNADFGRNAAGADSSLFTKNLNHKHPRSYSGGVDFSYKPRSRTEWNTYFDWVLHRQPEDQYQTDEFQKPDRFANDTLRGDMQGTIRIYAAESHLTFPIGKTKWETGAKSSFISVDNSARYDDLEQGIWIGNTGLSKAFSYKENINAAYIQTSARLANRLALQAGLRVEHTHVQGKVFAGAADSAYTHRYVDWFPTASLEYTLASGNTLSVLFARRITRPDYQDMNPFVYIFDEYLHERGNPELKPALSNHLSLTFALQRLGQASLFFLWIKDPIVKSFHREGVDRMLVYPANLTSRYVAGLRLQTAILHPLRRWQISGSFSLNYGRYGWTEENNTEENTFLTPTADLNNRLDLGKGWTVELQASFRGKASEGQAVGKPFFLASGGIRKSVFNRQGTFSLVVDDIFRSGLIRGTTTMPGRMYESRERRQGRLLHLSFAYRFRSGEGAKSSQQKRKTEEEKRIR